MKSGYQVLLSLLAMSAALLLASCGHSPSGCPETSFGNTNCSSSSSSSGGTTFTGGQGGSGGGSGSTPTAFAYAIDTGGTVDGYGIFASNNTFTALTNTPPAIPPNDAGVGMVVAQKQFIYAALEVSGEIGGWSFNSNTGALTALTGFPAAMALNLPNVTYNQYNMGVNPNGTLLFIADTGLSQIFVFQISSTGALTPAPGSPFPTPIEPGNLTTDGLGKYLYVCSDASGHIGTDVLAYSIGSNGALTALPGSPFSFPMWQLQGDASGQFLFGTTGKTLSLAGADDNNLYVFSIQQTGASAGAITAVSGSPFTTTYSPFTIATMSPSTGNESVYSFSINDQASAFNPIEGYQLNTTTGALTAISGSPFSNIPSGDWGQFDQLGSYLVVDGNATTSSATQPQLNALSVASSGALSQSISPTLLVTTGYWVVTDP
jgi:6-phosphogluconolactonase